jgi:hypothetical protein
MNIYSGFITSVNEATFMNNSDRCSLGFKKPLPWSDWSLTAVGIPDNPFTGFGFFSFFELK